MNSCFVSDLKVEHNYALTAIYNQSEQKFCSRLNSPVYRKIRQCFNSDYCLFIRFFHLCYFLVQIIVPQQKTNKYAFFLGISLYNSSFGIFQLKNSIKLYFIIIIIIQNTHGNIEKTHYQIIQVSKLICNFTAYVCDMSE